MRSCFVCRGEAWIGSSCTTAQVINHHLRTQITSLKPTDGSLHTLHKFYLAQNFPYTFFLLPRLVMLHKGGRLVWGWKICALFLRHIARGWRGRKNRFAKRAARFSENLEKQFRMRESGERENSVRDEAKIPFDDKKMIHFLRCLYTFFSVRLHLHIRSSDREN